MTNLKFYIMLLEEVDRHIIDKEHSDTLNKLTELFEIRSIIIRKIKKYEKRTKN